MKHMPTALAAALSAMLVPAAARAADEVTDAMQAAYAPYRAALFRTNSKAQAESEQAMASARKAWTEIVQRYAARAPAPYDRDPQFRATLQKVDAVYARSQALVQGGQLAEAHEALEEARDLLAELRARNGVITFSDHMNEYHAQMEAVLDKGGALLEQPSGALLLLERAGVLAYLAGRLREAAPEAVAGEQDFAGMHKSIQDSVENLRAALLRQDTAAARRALDGLKGPYSRMFVKYG